MTLSENIKAERIKKGLSQAQLGELLNVTQQAVGKWEKAQSEPDSNALKNMATIFSVTLDYLFGFEQFTPEEKAAGIGNHPANLSVAEWDWLELRSLILENHDEKYLDIIITMLTAIANK